MTILWYIHEEYDMKRVSSTSNNNSPVAGWKLQDQKYLQMHDNAASSPEWQLLTEDDWENDEPKQRRYHCSICFARLDYLQDTKTIWICSNCSQTYDTSIQDAPIKDMSESKVRTYTELSHYPTYEENDIYMPFMEGIDVGEQDNNIPGNIEVVYDDGRHKHIRVKGLPIEASAIKF